MTKTFLSFGNLITDDKYTAAAYADPNTSSLIAFPIYEQRIDLEMDMPRTYYMRFNTKFVKLSFIAGTRICCIIRNKYYIFLFFNPKQKSDDKQSRSSYKKGRLTLRSKEL